MGKNSQQHSDSDQTLCRRLVEIRQLRYGERGKSAFARDLGIPITTYVHYEAGRLPPADLLVQAAKVTGVRLEWLMSGEGPRDRPATSGKPKPSQRMADKLVGILDRFPQLAPSVEEFLQLLERVRTGQDELPTASLRSSGGLIPVVGSTAAGLAHYWSELESTHGGPAADARLEEILAKHSQRSVRATAPLASGSSESEDRVALVQYSRPDAQGFLEFLSADSLKKRHPSAVAWRIDGDSMSPRYEDGDFVITSPDHPAVEMHPCVARQKGQIGVNCKLYQSDGNDILLIPINEAYPVQRVPKKSLNWAWRVLASVRLG